MHREQPTKCSAKVWKNKEMSSLCKRRMLREVNEKWQEEDQPDKIVSVLSVFPLREEPRVKDVEVAK